MSLSDNSPIFIHMKNSKSLWEYVNWMMTEDDDSSEELLLEPDESVDQDSQNEQSVAAGVAGVTTPLGTDSTYPKSKNRKTTSQKEGRYSDGTQPLKMRIF